MYIIFNAMLSNYYVDSLPWKYITENWIKMTNIFGKKNGIFGHIICSSLMSLSSVNEIQKATIFLDENYSTIEHFKNKINQAFERTNMKLNWYKRDYQNIKQWVDKTVKENKKTDDRQMLRNLGIDITKY